MSFSDTLRKNLTPELYEQVMDQLGDDFDFDLVPRSRLNAVIKQRNTLRAQLAGDPQPSNGTEPGTLPNELPATSPPVDIEALKQQWQAEQGDAVMAVRIEYAALDKLRALNAIDPELIWDSKLIDKSKLTLEGREVKGLEDQLQSLQESKPQLFAKAAASSQSTVPAGTGKNGGDAGYASVTTKAQFLQLPIKDQLAFKQANPEVFNSFMQN